MCSMEYNCPGVVLQFRDMMRGRPEAFIPPPCGVCSKSIQVKPAGISAGAHQEIAKLVLVVVPAETFYSQGVFAQADTFIKKVLFEISFTTE